MVLMTNEQSYYTVYRRNTLRNPSCHLCVLGKYSWWERRAFQSTGHRLKLG
ncbi:hypothetical protein E2C01_101973 [Portunus trituberculatus]|uniref:Uncharacterized protein n=1 Tax=Portunus trituberculatus TaxID=210409 RepID=A0A5B7KG62_PORTR|nr:hypothetical protein [Portunus trituberculatus]